MMIYHNILSKYYLYLVILIFTLIFFPFINIYAFIKAEGLGQFLQNQYLNAGQGEYLEQLPKSSELGDIYNVAYGLALNNELSPVYQTISESMVNLYQQKFPQSNLNYNDIINIFVYTNNGGIMMNWNRTKEVSPDDFVKSCDKLMQGKKDKRGIVYHDKLYFENCKQEITNGFNMFYQNIKDSNELNDNNYGNDIYFNGDISDSSFDLLLDIQQIGKLLFKDNLASLPVSMYRPTDMFAHANANNNNTTNSTNSSNQGNTTNSTNSSNQGNTTNSTNSSNQGNTTNSTKSPDQGNTTNSTNSSNQGNNNTSNNNKIPNQNYKFMANNMSSAVIQGNNPCGNVSPYSPSIQADDNKDTSTTNNDIIINNKIDELQQSVDDIYTYNGKLDKKENKITKLSTKSDTRIDNYSQTESQVNGFRDNIFPIGNNGGLFEVNNQDEADSKEKCTVSGNPDGQFYITLCLIPQVMRGIADFKKVNSIEEIIEEIVNVLLKLKADGTGGMKVKKTDEFWEIGFQDLKLDKILAFNLVLEFKPLVFQNNKKAESDKQIKANLKIENDIKGNGNSPNEAKVINKYVPKFKQNNSVTFNELTTKLEKQAKEQEVLYEDKKKKGESIDIQQELLLNYEIMLILNKFIHGNQEKLDNLYGTLIRISDIALSLSAKK